MNWRYARAASYRVEAHRSGLMAERYRRNWADSPGGQRAAQSLAQTARDYRRMANELEAQI